MDRCTWANVIGHPPFTAFLTYHVPRNKKIHLVTPFTEVMVCPSTGQVPVPLVPQTLRQRNLQRLHRAEERGSELPFVFGVTVRLMSIADVKSPETLHRSGHLCLSIRRTHLTSRLTTQTEKGVLIVGSVVSGTFQEK
jgi:hypothetical protein